jgi:hypothetical protein
MYVCLNPRLKLVNAEIKYAYACAVAGLHVHLTLARSW